MGSDVPVSVQCQWAADGAAQVAIGREFAPAAAMALSESEGPPAGRAIIPRAGHATGSTRRRGDTGGVPVTDSLAVAVAASG